MLETLPLLSAAVDVQKAYRKDKIQVPVLQRRRSSKCVLGEFLSVVGKSGSGKKARCCICSASLDQPDTGRAVFLELAERIDNQSLPPAEKRDRLRNQTFGFIFQFYHLLPELLNVAGKRPHAADDRSLDTGSWLRQLPHTCAVGPRNCLLDAASAFDSPRQAQAARTVRRRDAARGHRSRPHQRSESVAGRRTNRQPRHRRPEAKIVQLLLRLWNRVRTA